MNTKEERIGKLEDVMKIIQSEEQKARRLKINLTPWQQPVE